MDEPVAILLLPSSLEEFELAGHARDLLSIPRVLALEPSRVRTPRFLRESIPLRQARRLRFPGTPRVLVVYDPAQYPLARALAARYTGAELWYVDAGVLARDSREDVPDFDDLLHERAAHIFAVSGSDVAVDNQPLRQRLLELDIISSRPFVPGARM